MIVEHLHESPRREAAAAPHPPAGSPEAARKLASRAARLAVCRQRLRAERERASLPNRLINQAAASSRAVFHELYIPNFSASVGVSSSKVGWIITSE